MEVQPSATNNKSLHWRDTPSRQQDPLKISVAARPLDVTSIAIKIITANHYLSQPCLPTVIQLNLF